VLFGGLGFYGQFSAGESHAAHGSVFSVLHELGGDVGSLLAHEVLGHDLVEVVVEDLVHGALGPEVGAGLLVQGRLVGLPVLVHVLGMHVVRVLSVGDSLPLVELVHGFLHRQRQVSFEVDSGVVVGLGRGGERGGGQLAVDLQSLGGPVGLVLEGLDLGHRLFQQSLGLGHSLGQQKVLLRQVPDFRVLLVDHIVGVGVVVQIVLSLESLVLLFSFGHIFLLLLLHSLGLFFEGFLLGDSYLFFGHVIGTFSVARTLEVLPFSLKLLYGLIIRICAHDSSHMVHRAVFFMVVGLEVRMEVAVESVIRNSIDQLLLSDLVGVSSNILIFGILETLSMLTAIRNMLERGIVIGGLRRGLGVAVHRGGNINFGRAFVFF